MDLNKIDPNSMSPEDKAKLAQSAQGLLRMLQASREDANDTQVVWIENRHGVRNPVTMGYWRKFMSKHQTEAKWRLLNPEEVQAEQDKIRQAEARQIAEREAAASKDLEALSILELQRRMREMEAQLEAAARVKAESRDRDKGKE